VAGGRWHRQLGQGDHLNEALTPVPRGGGPFLDQPGNRPGHDASIEGQRLPEELSTVRQRAGNWALGGAQNRSRQYDPVEPSKRSTFRLVVIIALLPFQAGQTALPWPDAGGTMHNFTSTAQFQSLATALAIRQAPGVPATVP
jgi:hypothetical protein